VPTYDYQCRSCGSVTEVIHSMLEEGPSVCARCGGGLRRVLHPAGIIFKGSGFYRTDARRADAASGDSASSAGSDAKGSTSTASTSPTSGGEVTKDSKSSKGSKD